MHPYEDRIRAVALHIRLGKRLSATIHQVVCPAKKLPSLAGTISSSRARASESCTHLSVQKHSDQQKRVAAKHCLDHDRCIASTMWNWDIPDGGY